ncbi:MAG: RimK family alpha-L-glutamate ligase [Eubacterium sp.]|nr:RimK family alpha-L-glutamate ligase [Eubacterium sp.]
MKGIIIVNAYSESEEYLYQAKRMKEEFEKLGVEADIIKNNRFLLYIKEGKIVSDISENDFCVYWDKDKYILSMLEKSKMPTFNSAAAIMNCDDKMQTYIALADNSLPLPNTLAGLLCYTENEEIKEETINTVEKLGYPLIVKESYGSLGQEVFLAKNRKELIGIMTKVKCSPHLFQEYIESSYSRDVRIIVVGKKVIGGMLRKGKNDFRSNIGSGGSAQPFELSDEMKEIAIRTAEILNLDYCGIDILFGKYSPIICEVNSNAFFYEFEKTTKINVAKEYAEYIISKIKRG